jgi:hypothetical protein
VSRGFRDIRQLRVEVLQGGSLAILEVGLISVTLCPSSSPGFLEFRKSLGFGLRNRLEVLYGKVQHH